MSTACPPIRTLADIEDLERVPLEERLVSHDVNVWIRRGLALAPQKPAIQYIANGDPDSAPLTITYGELEHRVIQAANLLHAFGVRPDDAVVTLLPTIPQLYVAMLAALAAGIACPLNWMLEPEQWLATIVRSRASLVVALGPTPGFDIWDKLQTIRDRLPASVRVLSVQAGGGEPISASDFDLLASQHPDGQLTFHREAKRDDVAVLMQSGGTTGSPKLVKLTHGGCAYKLWLNTLVMDYRADDVVFSEFPLFHIAGLFSKGVMAIADGMTIVIPSPLGARDQRFIANYWKFVEKFRITILSGIPTTLAQLTQRPPQGEDLSSLRRHAVTGSTAFPAEIATKLERMTGVRMLGTYGATEYTQNVTQAPRDGEAKYGSSGLRLPYTQVKTVALDHHGDILRECATDEIGVVVVKGPSVTPGYVDPAHDAFTRDGWFNSGDLGRIDADGYLWITGRVKDIIIRGGHNIEAAVIEEALQQHPAVLLAAAVGRPDAHAGELPVAYVELAAGAQAEADELLRFVETRIPERAAVPKEIVVVGKMPLTDVGKPAKAELRLDAARRAFAAVLADCADESARIAVDVTTDASKGQLVVLTVEAHSHAEQSAIERCIRDRMQYFATPFTIRWAAPEGNR